MSELSPSFAQRLLGDCRELFERELGEWLGELGPQIVEKLQEIADNTREQDKRNEYLRLRDDVQLFWDRLVKAFRSQLAEELAQAVPRTLSEVTRSQDAQALALVDDQELTERIVTREFIARLDEACREEMYALDRRMAQLVGQEEMDRCGNRFAPPAICAAAQAGCTALLSDPDPAARILLLRQLERALHDELPRLYRALNEVLIGAGILPEFKRSYRNAAAGSDQPARRLADGNHILDTLQRLARARLPTQALPAESATGGRAAPLLTGELPLSLPDLSAFAGSPPLMPPTRAISTDFLTSLHALQRQAPAVAGDGGPEKLTNVVHLARQSEAAQQAAPLDTITMDIVATLFDLIFDDDKVPEAVKGLVSRLQIPVLKVALLDQKFFADRSHPARRFLDSISGIAIRWGETINTGDPFYCKLSELIERIQQNFDQDVAVFGTAVGELSAFVNECEVLEEETSSSVIEVVQRREAAQQRRSAREEAARQASADLLARIISKKTPLPIEQFLREHWRVVLEQAGMADAESDSDSTDAVTDAPAFQAAARTAEDLAWSVTAKHSAEDRQRFAAMLADLLPALHQGLAQIGIDEASRQPFFERLMALHAAALHADRRTLKKAPALADIAVASAADTDSLPGAAVLQVTHLVENGIQIEDVALLEPAMPDDSPLGNPWLRRVRQLVRGDWVEFIDHEVARRERLTWLSPRRSLYLFSNHATHCAISITPEALAHRLQNGTARLVDIELPLFERALDGALKVLDQAD
ncbi:MAG: DUF1631 domain-containing protein [Sterolibacterium sp.]|nr:DUF1631 domain-containing protein [Sterolibacterium sp.]